MERYGKVVEGVERCGKVWKCVERCLERFGKVREGECVERCEKVC